MCPFVTLCDEARLYAGLFASHYSFRIFEADAAAATAAIHSHKNIHIANTITVHILIYGNLLDSASTATTSHAQEGGSVQTKEDAEIVYCAVYGTYCTWRLYRRIPWRLTPSPILSFVMNCCSCCFCFCLFVWQRRRNPQRQKAGGAAGSGHNGGTPAQQFPWDSTESRPLIKSMSREAGEDYWIDEGELAQFEQQQQAIKNRKAMEGEVSKEKLWKEVKAPYQQNWIGYFSVGIAILSAIIIKFPELLDQPTIPIPDL